MLGLVWTPPALTLTLTLTFTLTLTLTLILALTLTLTLNPHANPNPTQVCDEPELVMLYDDHADTFTLLAR